MEARRNTEDNVRFFSKLWRLTTEKYSSRPLVAVGCVIIFYFHDIYTAEILKGYI